MTAEDDAIFTDFRFPESCFPELTDADNAAFDQFSFDRLPPFFLDFVNRASIPPSEAHSLLPTGSTSGALYGPCLRFHRYALQLLSLFGLHPTFPVDFQAVPTPQTILADHFHATVDASFDWFDRWPETFSLFQARSQAVIFLSNSSIGDLPTIVKLAGVLLRPPLLF
jgi:hypothetical protein